jgi:hypothetical protein
MSKLTRRQSALVRLQKQLEQGVKPVKSNGKTTNETVALLESDKVRIQKQIEILSQKVI